MWAVILVACSGSPQTLPPPSSTPSQAATAQASARPLASAALGCTASFAESFRSVQSLVERADVVARGRVTADEPTVLYAVDASGRQPRGARVTTLAVEEVFKGAPAKELKILADACPAIGPGPHEWLVFGSLADPRYGPDAAGPHYVSIGGPQGQIRLAAGRVAGPYYGVQSVARALDDLPLAVIGSELRAAVNADASPAARAIFEREGWSVVRTWSLTELTLPGSAGFAAPLQPLCGEATVEHCAALSARVGLDLRAGAGRDVRVLRYVLEYPTPVGGGPYPPTGVAVAMGGHVVGAWVLSAVTRDVYAVSDRANVPVDR